MAFLLPLLSACAFTIADGKTLLLLNQEQGLPRHAYFSASGIEPSWNLNIDNDSTTFTSDLENQKKIQGRRLTPAKKNGSCRYRLPYTQGEMRILIYPSDTTSIAFPGNGHQVVIQLHEGRRQPRQLVGVGGYRADYRLHDIWGLKGIKNKPFNPSTSGRHPRLELNVGEKTFLFFTGVREISGKLRVENNGIQFTFPSGLTGDRQERLLLRYLSRVRTYRIMDLSLFLGDHKDLLTFKKID